MKRSAYLLGVWLLVMGVLVMRIAPKKTRPSVLERLSILPRVSFQAVTTQSIRPMHTEDLHGRPWVADFIFTRCGGPCPLMSARMAGLQTRLPPEVRLVSFTVDPGYDTPAVLQAYAGQYHAGPARWIFARLDKKSLQALAEGFQLTVIEQGNSPAETRVIHSTQMVLVDKQGVVRAYYDSSRPGALARLEEDARTLLLE